MFTGGDCSIFADDAILLAASPMRIAVIFPVATCTVLAQGESLKIFFASSVVHCEKSFFCHDGAAKSNVAELTEISNKVGFFISVSFL